MLRGGDVKASMSVGVEDPRSTASIQAECSAESPGQRPLLSIVTPAYNEAENLPVMYQRLRNVLEGLDVEWEWIVVDDHSADQTFTVIAGMAGDDRRVHGVRLARNSGAPRAEACGLHHARGNCAIVMASDLQDPPEAIPALLAEWQKGAQVVWAVRARREGESWSTIGFSRLFCWLMRHVVGLEGMPPTGADFYLLDRCVVDAFCQFRESHVGNETLFIWMGFRQASIRYDKQARLHGRSGWSLEKKLKLAVDSVTSFTYLPIRMMSYAGLITALLGFLYAGLVVVNALCGRPPAGWTSLMVVVLVVGGVQMLMLGVLGEYLWRALDEARRRPRYVIESTTRNAR